MNHQQKIILGKSIILHVVGIRKYQDSTLVRIADVALNKIKQLENSDQDGIDLEKSSEYFRVFTTEKKVSEFIENNLQPRPTPNCSICKWMMRQDLKNGLPQPFKNICTAQGARYISHVYGNKICKQLYCKIKEVTK